MTLRNTMLAALAGCLTLTASAALAATPTCSHLQAQSPPSNPKDVFRTAVRVCDMPANCGMMSMMGGASSTAKPEASNSNR